MKRSTIMAGVAIVLTAIGVFAFDWRIGLVFLGAILFGVAFLAAIEEHESP